MDTIIAEKLAEIGAIGVKYAIENHEFGNRTHNLEDSYGYAIYKNGAIYGNPFLTNKVATEQNEGVFGHDEADKFLKGYSATTEGWSLVVVAAMPYGNFVQYMYGLDVLQSSELVARNAANQILRKIPWIQLP